MALNENARKWVEALRSGEYKQGKGNLNYQGKLCCLGVACELAAAEGKVRRAGYEDRVVEYDGEEAFLPSAVVDWLGLSSRAGRYTARNHRETDLAKRNDAGRSFKQIADVIESEPEGLFR